MAGRILLLIGLLLWFSSPVPTRAQEPKKMVLQMLPAKQHAIVLEASVNGVTVHLLLDTGSNVTSVSRTVLGVDSMTKTTELLTSSGKTTKVQSTKIALRVGNLTMLDAPATVMDTNNINDIIGTRIDGVLGTNFLKNFSSVTIDYKKSEMTLIF